MVQSHCWFVTNLIEIIQKRALKIVFPALSYANALTCSCFETLEVRRISLSKTFVDNLKLSEDSGYNPLFRIVFNRPIDLDHDYNLRREQVHVPFIKTERFKNYVTAKYF